MSVAICSALVRPEERGEKVANNPSTHTIFYGDSGAGKSTGASTYPKPMLVFMFDPFSKDMPYLKRGEPSELLYDDLGTPFRQVVSRKTGNVIIQVEYFIDSDPAKPEGYQRFLKRMARFQGDEYLNWKTVVADSVTFMELASRKNHQYKLNKTAKDSRQWYGGSKEDLEEMLMIRFGSLPMNVVVLAHVSEDKDELHGTFVRHPAGVGKLGKQLPAGYGELYRAYVKREEAEHIYLWQTRSDNMWACSSQIDAPEPCVQHYSALWGESGQAG